MQTNDNDKTLSSRMRMATSIKSERGSGGGGGGGEDWEGREGYGACVCRPYCLCTAMAELAVHDAALK